MTRVISYYREHKRLPDGFQSFEQQRSNYKCTLPSEDFEKWRSRFHSNRVLQTVANKNEKLPRVAILIVEGFLLYFNAELQAQLDVRFFLRISKDLMQKRRLGRKDYVLNDGSVWTDPPDYFEQVVWPSYVEGNSGLFKNADVIHGALQWPLSEQSVDGSPIRNLHLIDTEHLSVSEVCDIACDLLYKQIWLNNA